MQAAAELTRKRLAKVVLLGAKDDISKLAHQLNADISQVCCQLLETWLLQLSPTFVLASWYRVFVG